MFIDNYNRDVNDNLLEIAKDIKTLTFDDKETVFFKGFSKPEHDKDNLWIYFTRNENDLILEGEYHYSRFKEFKKAYQLVDLWEDWEDIYSDPDYLEYLDMCTIDYNYEFNRDYCSNCNSHEDPVNGDAVFFGYVGAPICPNCKREYF